MPREGITRVRQDRTADDRRQLARIDSGPHRRADHGGRGRSRSARLRTTLILEIVEAERALGTLRRSLCGQNF